MRLFDPIVFRHLDRKARVLGQQFSSASRAPWTIQADNLMKIVRREQQTGFGRDHRFDEIKTVEDFRRNVPIAGYEDLEPYLQRVYAGETSALFAEQSIRMFAMTSGTSARRKFVPVTDRFIEKHRLGWFLWALATYEGRQSLIFRDKFALSGNSAESMSPGGVPCGSISGLTARMQNPLVRRTYCLPQTATADLDTAAKYYLSWRVGLTRDVASWMSPNPSTHLNLARFGDDYKEQLIRDVRNGTVDPQYDFSDEILRTLNRRIRANPGRARILDRVVEQTGHLYPKDVWPNLGLIGCWLGGPLRAYLRYFPKYFGSTPRRDLGLIASEARMTIPLHDETPAGALDLFGAFFEFIPVDEATGDRPTVLLPHELVEDRDYYIVITTDSGLYRYNIQDVVRCVGWYGRSPLIEFLNKGRHFSNLTGEKLSEFQVARAAETASLRLNLAPPTFVMAPCFDELQPYYTLFVEPAGSGVRFVADELAKQIDRELQRINCEYESKRQSARLGPVRARPLPSGTWTAFDRRRLIETGGTAEQYKRPCLFPDLDFADRIDSLTAVASNESAGRPKWTSPAAIADCGREHTGD